MRQYLRALLFLVPSHCPTVVPDSDRSNSIFLSSARGRLLRRLLWKTASKGGCPRSGCSILFGVADLSDQRPPSLQATKILQTDALLARHHLHAIRLDWLARFNSGQLRQMRVRCSWGNLTVSVPILILGGMSEYVTSRFRRPPIAPGRAQCPVLRPRRSVNAVYAAQIGEDGDDSRDGIQLSQLEKSLPRRTAVRTRRSIGDARTGERGRSPSRKTVGRTVDDRQARTTRGLLFRLRPAPWAFSNATRCGHVRCPSGTDVSTPASASSAGRSRRRCA